MTEHQQPPLSIEVPPAPHVWEVVVQTPPEPGARSQAPRANIQGAWRVDS